MKGHTARISTKQVKVQGTVCYMPVVDGKVVSGDPLVTRQAALKYAQLHLAERERERRCQPIPETTCKHENLLVTSTETVTQAYDRKLEMWGDVESQTMESLDSIKCEDCGEDVTFLFDFRDGRFVPSTSD